MWVVFRPKVSGRGHIPGDGPFIIAANHLSFCDHIFIQLATRRPIYFIGKAERLTGKGFRGFVNRTFFTAIGIIPVVRDGGPGGVAALDTAHGVLERGDGFGIHPEGTRSPDGQVYKGRTGVGWLAMATAAPVIPCGLAGTERVQPAGKLMLRPRRFRMHFGAPMHFPDHAGLHGSAKARREVTDAVMREVQRLSGLAYVPRYATSVKA